MKKSPATITDSHGYTSEGLKRERFNYKSHSEFMRITIVIASMKGMDVQTIAEAHSLDKKTIESYIEQFNKGGLEGLLKTEKKTAGPLSLTNSSSRSSTKP